jgi:hypothetical protein
MRVCVRLRKHVYDARANCVYNRDYMLDAAGRHAERVGERYDKSRYQRPELRFCYFAFSTTFHFYSVLFYQDNYA